jgi:hypothetical protein
LLRPGNATGRPALFFILPKTNYLIYTKLFWQYKKCLRRNINVGAPHSHEQKNGFHYTIFKNRFFALFVA